MQKSYSFAFLFSALVFSWGQKIVELTLTDRVQVRVGVGVHQTVVSADFWTPNLNSFRIVYYAPIFLSLESVRTRVGCHPPIEEGRGYSGQFLSSATSTRR